ncbi:PREDICTED: uncharacterized protein LOC106744564 isoform X2 [Dinoponera quadriceps]|nr:PREDICTED: uncharacterized protein LOC106744564 isoform X2 [Dinoponera quadriceps]XP_014474940.1 PREDICTED: uncharacterized protein LOC106744564 isoform X2 [Dinoponera quadriceps]XP_014474941.1 PREDICTED: uncharacterized protein LOC106744564 isoform X2 [Dinoponera quadriceps]XP_014474942.1 PREDICTED: uncharacterized protein LOC106744564 isoform X2 [Dinoponera quadriceps]
MSMLAESRRKKKWSVDPQGKRWSKDNDKIGQKMLEKMGWTSGKGLGVNEQGITEHIRVNKRTFQGEKIGIGYDKDLYMKDICEHQNKFDKLLQQLAKHHQEEDETVEESASNKEDLNRKSLELMSKQSRARLHYQKFIRGKDTSKYSPRDLVSIFGKKELTSKIGVNVEEDANIYENEAIGTKDNWGGVVTINSGNMADYFKQKLPNHKENLLNNTINNQAADSESETEQCVGFGFIPKTDNTLSTNGIPKNFDEKSNYAFDNPCLRLNSPTGTTLNAEDSSKKSRKKRKKGFVPESANLYIDETNEVNVERKLKIRITDGDCKDGFTNLALNLDTKSDEDCNGKEFEVSRAQFGLENCALDLTDEKNNKKRVTFNDHVEYSIDATKKGKSTLDKFEVENKKHKKKRKRENVTTLSNGFVNEALDVEVSAEINDNELNEHKNTKIKKRKICKTSSLETIQELPEREKEISEINLEDVTLDTSVVENKEIDTAVKKKKKKKSKEILFMDNNIIGVVNEEADIIEKVIKNKKHKLDSKKREVVSYEIHSNKEDKEECEVTSNEILEKLNTDQQQINNHMVKIKKRKNRKEQVLVEDSAKIKTSPVVMTITEDSVPLETENTVRKKKKKRNKDNCLESEIKTCDVEKEISDKENTVEERESTIKLSKKDKKRKRSINELDNENSTYPSTEMTDANVINNQENIDDAEFIDTSSRRRKRQVIDFTNSIIHSPWNKKGRMTKKILKRFFYGNLIADFPGSNIQEIEGYGVDASSN